MAICQQDLLAWLPHVSGQDSQERQVFPGRVWTHEEGVASSHKLFELNARNTSLVSWTEVQFQQSCIMGAEDGYLEDRSGT